MMTNGVKGNMLERVITWDRDRAEAFEDNEALLLSSIPTADGVNKVDAEYIVETFRQAMRQLPDDDVRLKFGELDVGILINLLHFTFLVSRPVLAWELDIDDI